MDDTKKLKIVDNDGKETEYEILSAFQYGKTGKNYVVYTDNTRDENGSINAYAAIYYPDDETRLDPIETDEEWDLVEAALARLKEEDE